MIAALAALLCRPAWAQPGPSEPALAPAARTAAGARAPVSVAFETDPRVELLSVLVMLARPSSFGAAPPPYAERARAAFAPFAGHAAVSRMRDALAEAPGGELAELFLSLSEPPDLAPPADAELARATLLADARDFARSAGFAAFYKANAGYYRELAAAAKAEADRGLRPDSVTGYLRMTGSGRHRFIVAPLLPPEMAANLRTGSGAAARFSRIRSADYSTGSARLSFGVFGSGAAHETAHDLLDPLAAAHRAELDAYSGLMYDGCAGSWSGCVSEHVDLAVTLRALAAERGEAAYEAMLGAYGFKYPYLRALCVRLKEWEARPDGSFAEFYPRLTDVFKAAATAPAPPRLPRPR
jgi:hypothetical protein